MIKKITAIALSALLLTACHAEEKEQQVTGTSETTATTPLTLTEIITEEIPFIPEEEEKQEVIELAVFNSFEDSIKVEDEVYRELSEAVEKISDSNAFLSGNLSTGLHTGECCRSKYCDNYADKGIAFSEDGEYEHTYHPLNPDIAQNEEELYERVRSAFTENMYTDDAIRERLFAPLPLVYNNDVPNYKTIDGTLCVNDDYKGVMTDICFTQFSVISYDENRVELSAIAIGIEYPSPMAFMTIVKSEEYGWQLDSLEMKPYFRHEANLLYTGLKLKEEQLNTILSGGTQPENPLTTIVDGESYTETYTGMTLTEMQEFFAEMFSERIQPAKPKTIALREVYTQTYIDEVYYELDGVLYRKDSAPKWYCPEIQIDPYAQMSTSESRGVRYSFTVEQSLYDKLSDSTFKAEVSMTYHSDFYDDFKTCSYVQVSSELPIKPLE